MSSQLDGMNCQDSRGISLLSLALPGVSLRDLSLHNNKKEEILSCLHVLTSIFRIFTSHISFVSVWWTEKEMAAIHTAFSNVCHVHYILASVNLLSPKSCYHSLSQPPQIGGVHSGSLHSTNYHKYSLAWNHRGTN